MVLKLVIEPKINILNIQPNLETQPIIKIECPTLLRYTAKRIRQRLGAIYLFTGAPGKGKSYAGLRFLELWYNQQFNERFPTKHICEKLEQAVMLVKDFKRIGEGILIEELSVHASNRDSLTIQNKMWNRFIDICREKQAVIICNCPHISFIDKHIVMLSNVWVDCLGVDFRKKVVITKPLWLQVSPHKAEPYKHKFFNEEGYEIDLIEFNKPQDIELVDFYNHFKKKNNTSLYDDIKLRMEKDRLKKSGLSLEHKGPVLELTPREEEVMKAMANNHYTIAAKMIGITPTSLYRFKRKAISKGHNLQEFRIIKIR